MVCEQLEGGAACCSINDVRLARVRLLYGAVTARLCRYHRELWADDFGCDVAVLPEDGDCSTTQTC